MTSHNILFMMSLARYITLHYIKIFIWSVEMCFIFVQQINIIFMWPLYKAIILCDCIIKWIILGSKTSNGIYVEPRDSVIVNRASVNLANDDISEPGNMDVDIVPQNVVYITLWLGHNSMYSHIIWTASNEFGTYRLCEQRRFRRACASAQSRQNLHCSLIQAVNQEEPSNRKPDPWPL